MRKKLTKPEREELAKSIGERFRALCNPESAPYADLALYEKLQFCVQLAKDIETYKAQTRSDIYNTERRYTLFTVIPELRRQLAHEGIIVRRNEDGTYSLVENIWSNARILPRRTHNLNEKLAAALAETGMSNRQISEASGANQTLISAYLHNKESPLTGDGEWAPDAKRLCAFLGYNPEDLFPERIWRAARRSAYLGYMRDVYERNMNYGFTHLTVTRREIGRRLKIGLARLDPVRRKILMMHFGLGGLQAMGLNEIARRFDVGYMRVLYAERDAFRFLSRLRIVRPLRDCISHRYPKTDNPLDSIVPLVEKASDVLRPSGRPERWPKPRQE